MPSLTYQEKSLYAILAAELVVYGLYFARISNTPADLARLCGSVVLLVLVQIAAQIVLAILSRDRITDERDLRIRALSYRAAYFTLTFGIFAIFALLWTGASYGSVFLINILFAAFLLAEIVRLATQLILYRTAV